MADEANPKEIKVAHDELSLLQKNHEGEEEAAGREVKVAETDAGDSEKPGLLAVLDDDADDQKKKKKKKKKEDDDQAVCEDLLGDSESAPSFREESSLLNLKDSEKKALVDLRSKLEDAIINNKLFLFEEEKKKDHPEEEEEEANEKEKEKSVVIKEEQGEEKEKSMAEEEKEKSMAEEEKKPNDSTAEGKEEENNPENLNFAEKIKEAKQNLGLIEETKEPPPPAEEEEEKEKTRDIMEVDQDMKLWGAYLLPSKGDKGTDVILLKFLRARDFKSQEAFDMLRSTLKWRKENNIDAVLEEEFPPELSSVAYMQGMDKNGHPICYNIFGTFLEDDIHSKIFGTEEMKHKFLRWRFQLMERGIKKLDFGGCGGAGAGSRATSMLQVTDLRNSPGPTKKDLRLAMKQAVALLQDNYPELVARNIFINVPFWSYAYYAVVPPFFTPRSKSKFDFARPAKVTETLLKYIDPQQIPVAYGGFLRENDPDFSIEDSVTEVTIKGGSSESIEILAPEVETKFTWEIIVLGWEVNYKEEFMPTDEGSYTMIVQKGRKVTWQEGPLRNSFKNKEAGKLVLTIDNAAFKKKRVLYRYKPNAASAATAATASTVAAATSSSSST